MTTEVKVPALPESVSDGVVAGWHKQPGDTIQRDEALVDIETDKVVLEVPAPQDGVLEKILFREGETVTADQVIGLIGANGAAQPASAANEPAVKAVADNAAVSRQAGPAARKLLAEYHIDSSQVTASGRKGQVTKSDVLAHVEKAQPAEVEVKQPGARPDKPAPAVTPTPGLPGIEEDRPQKRVPMSRLRARVAERLLHRDSFEQNHGVRLGFMSFFVRAAAEALKRHPDINASIDGDDIVYHGFCDIGVAISTDRGLVVPILRNAEYMSLAEIEADIVEFAEKGRDGKLSMADITGGTFSITNGGVFGSMLSTPILNPPQSAILGMHKIQDRAVVEDAAVVVRPIMYLALTYDHRIVDGKSAVTFLKTIVDLLEDPASMLLDL
jgi:2-oxoglutarate dehydrogenase E2 component (dihydrolipoamide succinyltransferase)